MVQTESGIHTYSHIQMSAFIQLQYSHVRGVRHVAMPSDAQSMFQRTLSNRNPINSSNNSRKVRRFIR